MSNARKMTSTRRSSCPCCDREIKRGVTIVLADGRPAVHERCYSMATDPTDTAPSYVDAAAYEAEREEIRRLWIAAAPKAPVSRDDAGSERDEDRGSFGGSQLAEDMGDFSGRR